MSIELITFIVMLGVFLVGCFACKLPVSLSMVQIGRASCRERV